MDRISIKNVHFSEALSEETNAFTADVYLDNKKFGYAKNSGHGGMTDIRPYPETKERYKEAEAYAIGLGEMTVGKFTFKSSLDMIVDELLTQHLEAKDLKREMNKGLVFKDKSGSIQLIKWKKMSLKQVMAHPQGTGLIKAKVLEVRSAGGKILNTNLTEEILK